MLDGSGVGRIFKEEWPRLVSVLVRDFGDLDLAEEAAQDAFLAAAERWLVDGFPRSPRAWLITTGRNKAIDRLRRETRFAQLTDSAAADSVLSGDAEDLDLVDEQLALLLGCCHPALARDGQVALTLRAIGGLSTDQIARAFLVSPSTMTRRLTRAKTKIRAAGIALTTPAKPVLLERLGSVRHVIYLIFNEGHTSTASTSLVRGDLCDEAIWLAELLVQLVPDDPEVRGLAALVSLIDARRASRIVDGAEVLLADQNRSRWDRAAIDRGLAHLGAAHSMGSLGPFQLQAAIASLHVTVAHFDDTNWPAIVRLYDGLLRHEASPIVALNRAIAVSYADGLSAGLELVESLAEAKELQAYPYTYSTHGELLARSGRLAEAIAAFETALNLSTNEIQVTSLKRRRTELERALTSCDATAATQPSTRRRNSP